MSHLITLIPGDHTSPNIARGVQSVLHAAGVNIEWDQHDLEEKSIGEASLTSIQKNRVALLGFHHGWRDRNMLPPVIQLREKLCMFANIRPIHSLHGLESRHTDLDLVIVREVTEDVYGHLEHESIPGVFESLKVTTKASCERIIRFAFEYARTHGRKKVTIVHKSNIMKKSDGLFLKTGREVALEYPDITTDEVIVDALCMKLVISPSKFDVLVTGNLYGDIVADLCAGLVGGASNAPSINLGPEHAVFGATHGDPSDLKDLDAGNPLVLLLPALELLKHIKEEAAADRIRTAIEKTLSSGVKPFAVGGKSSASEFCAAVAKALIE